MLIDAELLDAIRTGVTVIVPSRQRAAALRLAYARSELASGRQHWLTPEVLPWEAWLLRSLSRRMRAADSPGLQLLNPSQEAQLWSQALTAVAGAGEPLSQHAGGIARAAALLREWRLPSPAGGGSDEVGVLAAALRGFRKLSTDHQALSVALADDQLLRQIEPAALLFAGFGALTPRQQFVADALRERGANVNVLRPAAALATPLLCSGKDWHAEARAAGQWAAALLREDPSRRILVVSANRQLEQQSVFSQLAEQLAPDALLHGERHDANCILAWEGGQPLHSSALVRTATTLLTLAAGNVEFDHLSALLRSPYQSLGDDSDCALLELWLRELRHTRFDWPALHIALQKAPAAFAGVAQRLATAVSTLRAAFASTLRFAPGQWAQRISEHLQKSGFPGPRSLDSRELQLLLRWQELLEEFASLDAVVGAMHWQQALGVLQQLVERIEHQAATGDAAVTLTTRRDDPIVQYDGIWVMGLEEQLWPEPLRPDAFIPLVAQRQAQMPAASTAQRLLEARRQLAAWSVATPRLVLSYPQREADLAKRPSVLLQGDTWQALPAALPALMLAGQATDLLRDEMLPPIVVPAKGLALRAGTRLPELQRSCPFRAQAELRLGAQPLQSPSEGIDPRDRGTLLHYALEHVWRQLVDSRGLLAMSSSATQSLIGTAVVAAEARLLRHAIIAPGARPLRRERDRNSAIIHELLELETGRGTFAVHAMEVQVGWTVDGATLRMRVDRIDRLADGGLVLLDYKSGKSTVMDLLGARARPVQLLAYLAALDPAGQDAVGALAIVQLTSDKASFKGVAESADRLPLGKHWDTGDWAAWRATWIRDAHGLVRQHLAGVASVDPLPDACRYCHLPGLCRIKSLAPVFAAALEESGDE
ncbi:MAG: PD-(D/E)XK nuclease family protein [Pseudomonadota bacterium]